MVTQVRRETPALRRRPQRGRRDSGDRRRARSRRRADRDGSSNTSRAKGAVLVARRDRLTRLDVDAGHRAGPRRGASKCDPDATEAQKTAAGGLDRPVARRPGHAISLLATRTSVEQQRNQNRTRSPSTVRGPEMRLAERTEIRVETSMTSGALCHCATVLSSCSAHRPRRLRACRDVLAASGR